MSSESQTWTPREGGGTVWLTEQTQRELDEYRKPGEAPNRAVTRLLAQAKALHQKERGEDE